MHTSDIYHPNAELQQKLAYLFSLRQSSKVNWDRTGYLGLLETLGNPQHHLPPVIHVAGTNGKGSIVATLRAIFEAQGYKVHAYTSPHLIVVNERIYVAGENISDERLEALIDEIMPYFKGKTFSFFEIMTAIALLEFSRIPGDVLLLEVGCGGRLDCTNVVDKPLSTIISRISMDHTEYLGDTLAKIASEKAGIMKASVPCIISYQGEGSKREEIFSAFESAAKETAAKPLFFGRDWDVIRQDDQIRFTYRGETSIVPLPNLQGAHQIWNVGAALMALEGLKQYFKFSENSIQKGLTQIHWQGRMQRLSLESFSLPVDFEVWLDSGHNDSAGEIIANQIKEWKKQDQKPVHLIVGMLGSKDIGQFLAPLLPECESLTVVPIPGETGSKTLDDVQNALKPNLTSRIKASIGFLEAVREIASQKQSSRILIAGSVYLAGNVLKFMGNEDAKTQGSLEKSQRI